MLLFVLFYLGVLVFLIVAMWKLFEKAEQPGWAAIIPIYNTYIMLKIGGKPGWWLLLMFIPFVNLIFAVWMMNMISKSFGKDEGFTVGLVLLGIVFIPLLAFGDSRYLGPYGDPEEWNARRNQENFEFEHQDHQNLLH